MVVADLAEEANQQTASVIEQSGGRAVAVRCDVTALLHLVSSRHGEVAIRFWRQIAKASSSNATASRKVAGSSTASS